MVKGQELAHATGRGEEKPQSEMESFGLSVTQFGGSKQRTLPD